MRLVLVVAIGIASLTACGGSGDGCADAGTGAKTGEGTAGEIAYLTDVSVEAGECDRLELAFESARPGFRVAYEPAETALSEDGSGRRIEARGSAFLVVRLEPAATARADDDGNLTMTYEGPRRIAGAGDRIAEAVKVGDFEAVVRWTIALPEERPFAVSAEGDRIVVEIG